MLSAFPFSYSILLPFISLYLLGTLLAVIGSGPPRSQVARKLISPFLSPSPYTPHSKIPTPWGLPDPNIHITKTTSRNWLTRSSTVLTLSQGGSAHVTKTDFLVLFQKCFQRCAKARSPIRLQMHNITMISAVGHAKMTDFLSSVPCQVDKVPTRCAV